MKTIKSVIFLSVLSITFCLLAVYAFSAEEEPCLTCHAEVKQPAKSLHAALALGCSACHKAVDGINHPGKKGGIVLTENMPTLCFKCHDASKFKGKSVHQPVTGGMCTGCHNPHKSDFPKILIGRVPELCYNCHQESKFKGNSGHTLLGMCTGCHNPHSSNSDNILKSNQPDLCYSCHDKAKFTKKYVHQIINMGGCTSCHAPHISDHPFLLSSSEYQLCISCHAAKEKEQHVVGLPGRKRHPVKGVIDPSTLRMIKRVDPKNPQKQVEVPDPNVPGKMMSCSSCHAPHSSDFKGLLTAEKICIKCHKY